MAHPGKSFHGGSESSSSGPSLSRAPDRGQLDFEIEFFGGVLERHPDFVDVLRVMGNLLTLKGRYGDALHVHRRLVQLRPHDSLAHYNLAGNYALLKRKEQALATLRQAVELGYRDFRYMREDHDLDFIRHDPRFRQLLREFENR
jgi:tetratricopeptide (TPR) repeat protein